MFRDSGNSPMDKSKFGVGSTILAGSKNFVVIGVGDNKVAVLDLNTFQTVRGFTTVTDINFLTANEARDLVDKTVGDELQYTFTDFDLIPAGVKFKDFTKF